MHITTFASESSGLLDSVSLGSILLAFIFLGALALVIRAAVRLRKQPPPTSTSGFSNIRGSIILLSISLTLLIAGTIISLTINDPLGGAIASLSGVVSMIEQRRRHKRES